MRNVVILAIFLVFSVSAQAQGPTALDYGIASEVARSAMIDDVGRSILGNTNLMSRYRSIALDEEMAREAVRRGLTERIFVQRLLEQSRRSILIQALRAEIDATAPAPTEKMIKKEYEAQSESLVAQAGLKLDVFSIASSDATTLGEAKLLLEEEENPAAELVKLGYVHVTAQLPEPWLTAGQVAAPVWTNLQAMADGEVGAFPDGDNTLLIRRLASREARTLTLEEAREFIRTKLLQETQNERWNAFYAEKAKAAGIELPDQIP